MSGQNRRGPVCCYEASGRRCECQLKSCCVLAERTHAWLAQAELPAEFEYSAKSAAKLKERCDSYTARMSNPFDTRKDSRKEAPAAPEQPATQKKPNVFKRFIACITIEPW